MSIFPDYAKRKKSDSAKHIGAEPRASSLERDPSRSKAERGSNEKPHRFDKFARRVAANLLEALRVTLTVFTSPDKERWPMVRLISHLKGAEELARDMLREIAEKIFVRPMIVRERSVSNSAPPESSRERVPYFRLGVTPLNATHEDEGDQPQCRHPGREAIRDLLPQVAEVVAGGPPNKSADDDCIDTLIAGANRDDDTLSESSLDKRLQALEDVLSHPGKHAARMARALYRAEHGKGDRLMALSPDDRLLENIIAAMAANARGDDAGLTRLHGDVMRLEPG